MGLLIMISRIIIITMIIPARCRIVIDKNDNNSSSKISTTCNKINSQNNGTKHSTRKRLMDDNSISHIYGKKNKSPKCPSTHLEDTCPKP